MPISLGDLAAAVSAQRPALLLGAGASVPSGAPAANELGNMLAKILSPEISGQEIPLSTLTELIEIKRGRRPLVDEIRKIFVGLQATGGILALPLFPWKTIYSTNYDQLIENAFTAQHKHLEIIRSDYDYPAIDQANENFLYKIHGCLSQDRSLGDHGSMVLTDSDYTNPSTYRENIFKRLELDIFGRGILIIGQSLRDKHLSDMVRLAASKQESYGYRNKVKLLCYEADPNLALLFESKNIQIAFGGIDQFMDALLSQNNEHINLSTTSSRENLALPASIVSSSMSVIAEIEKRPRIDGMYNGRPATYAEIRHGYTFARDIENELSTKFRLGHRILPVIGVAGVGKTTATRRFVFERHSEGSHAWEHRTGFRLRPDAWASVHRNLLERKETGFLLIDEVNTEQRQANQLLEAVRTPEHEKFGLFIITTAEISQWAPRQKSPDFFKYGEPLRISRLSETEIDSLLRLIGDAKEIRRLISQSFRSKTPAKQKKELLRRSQGDMFVSLKTLFSTESLDWILLNEYAALEEYPREIYKIVSALEAAGLTVHRQLVLRLLNISPNYLSSYLSSLDGLVEEHDNRSSDGIYVWQTRHKRIAETISKYKFSDLKDLLELLNKVAENINPSVDLERRFIADVCNSEFGIRRLPNAEDRIELYEKLIKLDPKNRVPRHRLIGELLEKDDLHLASVTIADAESTVGSDPPIQRYKCLLNIELSQQAGLMDEDRRALLRIAKSEAEKGIKLYQDSMYQYFAFNDAAKQWHILTNSHEWLEESLTNLRKASDRLLDPRIREEASATERILRSQPKN